MHHITSPNTLEANFTWELRNWRFLSEYYKNKKENVETSIKSPYLVTENEVKWQMTMTFKAQQVVTKQVVPQCESVIPQYQQGVRQHQQVGRDPYGFSRRVGSGIKLPDNQPRHGNLYGDDMYDDIDNLSMFCEIGETPPSDHVGKNVIEFKCYCVSKPTYNPKEDCLGIQGTLETLNNCNSQSTVNNSLHKIEIDEFITEAPLEKSWKIDPSRLPKNFKIEANFTIGGWKTSEDVLAPTEAKPQLASLLVSNEEFCDVTVVVGGQEIPAHKAVLAVRSPVLKATLSANMKEKQESRIVLNDASAKGWRMFQQFLYTDNFGSSLALDLPLLAELLTLSEKYQVTAMRDDVGAKILRSMTVKNVFGVINLVENFNISGFNEKAAEIITTNWGILKSQQRLSMLMTSGSVLAQILLEKLHT